MMRNIEFVLFPNVLGLDITGPLEVFTVATEILKQKGLGQEGYRAYFSAHPPGMIRTTSGLTLSAPETIGSVAHLDTLIVPGGFGVAQMLKETAFLDAITACALRARRIISVCNGAFILAECGLLNGKKATTHWMMADELAYQYPEIQVNSDAIFIRDDHISTSAGVSSGIDLALAITESDFGSDIAREVAKALVLYFRRSGNQSQFSAPLKAGDRASRRFKRLHAFIMTHLDQSLTVETLAIQAAMSVRNFARTFTQHTGITPGKYVETLRLDLARELLETGEDNIAKIAEDSGFGREDRFRRTFKRRFGVSPGQYRLHFNA